MNATNIGISETLRGKVLKIADEIIATKYPTSYKHSHVHEYIIENEPPYWIVSWKPRKNILEGTPMVFISKDTLKVVKTMHFQ